MPSVYCCRSVDAGKAALLDSKLDSESARLEEFIAEFTEGL